MEEKWGTMLGGGLEGATKRGRIGRIAKQGHAFSGDTVDGQSPAPPRMMIIPLFIGF